MRKRQSIKTCVKPPVMARFRKKFRFLASTYYANTKLFHNDDHNIRKRVEKYFIVNKLKKKY